MIKTISLSLLPSDAVSVDAIKRQIQNSCCVSAKRITGYAIKKRSVDARSKQPKILLTVEVGIDEKIPEVVPFEPKLQNVANSEPVLIIGAGPAGLFAAIKLIEAGLRPIILERGKDVRSRRRDLAVLNRDGIVNPESNYCFGEGGAGTYSDGKLYTRSTKRGNVTEILQLFHYFGADEEILCNAHPHIGTNKLPDIITAMREQIIDCGGAVYFDKKVTNLLVEGDSIEGVTTADGNEIKSKYVILATGHSARDVFDLLHKKGIEIESKPFAIGVRIEHPQQIVDTAQYHCEVRDPYLPPASYSLVSQEEGRGVFSFCMCPGGIIAPAATAPGEIVVNGWSPSRRNNFYANSGTVVSVGERDFAKYKFTGPLAAMHFQQMVEQQAFKIGGGNLVAPAQRMVDFAEKRVSSTLPSCSYHPGITTASIDDVLPIEISMALRKGLVSFGKKMKGYFTNDAVLVATESRTSSPVRIPRDNDTLQHIQIKGLYPCAEGAGYAGGIVSAAIDGQRCAIAIAHLCRKPI